MLNNLNVAKNRRRFAVLLAAAFVFGGLVLPSDAFAEAYVGVNVRVGGGYGPRPMPTMGQRPVGPRPMPRPAVGPMGPLRAGVAGPVGPLNNYNYGPHGPQQGGLIAGGFVGGGRPCAPPPCGGYQQRCAKRVRCGRVRSGGCGGGFSLSIRFGRGGGRCGRRC